jgi:hypothetical protein
MVSKEWAVKSDIEFARQFMEVVAIHANRAPLDRQSLCCAVGLVFSSAEISHDQHAKWNLWFRSSERTRLSGGEEDVDVASRTRSSHSAVLPRGIVVQERGN